ncbi:MAG TPA: TetR/AcrR family transcriptional regulator [Holophagaceae bacterium]|nr:TetR/AcrR family transcriptional regulator [Holophagaceae bacterium]
MTKSSKPALRTRGPKAHRVEPDQILDAAERVFAAQGLQAASLRAIATEAGCDASLIYYHFESKEAMFLALLDRFLPGLHADLSALAADAARPVSERLWETLRLYHHHMGRHAGLRAIIKGELVRGAEGLQRQIGARLVRNAEQVALILTQGIQAGIIRPEVEPRLAAFFLVKTFIETLDLAPRLGSFLSEPARLDLPRATETWFQIYWRGVAVDPLAPLPALPVFPEL